MLQEITQSSLIEDGSKRGPWSPVIKSFAVKTCVVCRSEFRPSRKESCNQWAKRLFCSGACSGEARRKPKQAKERQDPWKGGRELIARKTCVVCGAIFRPRAGAPECEWEKRATCSKGCAPAAIRNPMKQKEVREKVSEALRAIANRCTASQERLRYQNARTLLGALNGWLQAEVQLGGGPQALLLDRLRTVGHLPALPGLAARVARVTALDSQGTGEIAEQERNHAVWSREVGS